MGQLALSTSTYLQKWLILLIPTLAMWVESQHASLLLSADVLLAFPGRQGLATCQVETLKAYWIDIQVRFLQNGKMRRGGGLVVPVVMQRLFGWKNCAHYESFQPCNLLVY